MSSVLELVQHLQRQLDESKLPLAALTQEEEFDLDAFLRKCISGKANSAAVMLSLAQELSHYLAESQSKIEALIHQDIDSLLKIPKGLKELDAQVKALHIQLDQIVNVLSVGLSRLAANKETAAGLCQEIEKLSTQEQVLSAKIRILENLEKVEKLVKERMSTERTGDNRQSAVCERVARLTAESGNYATLCPELKSAVQESAALVLNLLERSFRDVLITGDSVRHLNCLLRCFSILQSSDKGTTYTAEALIRELVTGPVVREAMETCTTLKAARPDSFLSLSVFYKILNKEIAEGRIRTVVQTGQERNGIKVLTNALWTEVQDTLVTTRSIFAPSFALEFRINFNETISFITSLKNMMSEDEKIRFTFEGFLKPFIDKWNLPAYFVIRQNEVLKLLYPKLAATGDLKKLLQDGEKPAAVFIRALELLWNPDYYIPYIHPRFLRLHFQLLSRYVTLVSQSSNKGESVNVSVLKELLVDVKTLEKYINTTIPNMLSALHIPLLSEIVTESLGLVAQIKEPCVGSYLQMVLQQCASNLNALRSVPGIYRMTNRPKPTAASPFADSFLRPLIDAHTVIEDERQERQLAEKVADSFRDVLSEVTEAISKSEQLFSKLKDKDPSSQSDSVKMLEQLKYDALSFNKTLEQWGLTATHPTITSISGLVLKET